MLLLAWTTGCQSLSIPRIDPTGQRIFLPEPYRVGPSDIFTHTDRNGLPTSSGILPDPAFQTPPTPPPCIDGSPNTGSNKPICEDLHERLHPDRGDKGQLLLTPTTIVAPVGGEVVLLAGICGEDGYLVTKEPIEWMLSPESVGTFLEVGDDAKGKTLRQWHAKPKVEKLDVDFAKGRTSSQATTITRGSARPNDDLKLKKGQTWISLSSPVEGTSRVTALAPDSEIWDKRRQTAIIYWVDAQWRFPDPQSVMNGQPATLRTQVFQSEGFVGAEGWKVRYRSLNPELARFLPSNADVAEVTVDASGNGTVQVVNDLNKIGTALFAIEVVRPANAADRMRELTLGQGQAIVTWSAPQLALDAGGPQFASPNQKLTYGASLANIGDVQAENVALRLTLPAGVRLIDTTPKATTQSDQGAEWIQGPLPARQQLNVSAVVVPLGPGDSRITFEAVGTAPGSATADMNPRKDIDLRTAIPQAQIKLEPANNITEIEVGKEAVFNVTIVNTGTQSLNNLILTITSDPGLQEAQTNRNSVQQQIPFLPPGQRAERAIRFIVRKDGQLSAQLQAKAENVDLGTTQAFIRGLPSAAMVPGISVKLTPEQGPAVIPIGGRNTFRAVVTNTGQLPLDNVQLELLFERPLEPLNATAGVDQAQMNQGRLVWTLPGRLESRQQQTYAVELGNNQGRGLSTLIANVRANPNLSATDRLQITLGDGVGGVPNPPGNDSVMPGGGGAGGGLGGGGAQPGDSILPGGAPPVGAAGEWFVQLTEAADPIAVGREANYAITIRNDQNQDDKDLVLAIDVPDGVQILSLSSIGVNHPTQFVNNARVVTEPIRTVRRGETLQWNLRIVPNIAADIVIRAEVRSTLQPNGKRVEIGTRVVAN